MNLAYAQLPKTQPFYLPSVEARLEVRLTGVVSTFQQNWILPYH